MGIFSLDGPFVKFMSLVADIIILSIIFIITSIPIITIGASTTAIFYVMTKRIQEKESYIIREYFNSFKLNFKQATLTWLLLTSLLGILSFNIYFINRVDIAFNNVLLYVYLFLFFELFFANLYVYPIIARFKLSLFGTIKNAFVLANKHIATTVSVTCLAVLISYITWVNPLLFVISMGVYTAFSSYFFMKVFKKYYPEMDLLEYEISYDAMNAKKEEINEKK